MPAGWTSACVSRQSIGMNRQGGLAERLVVPARFAWAIAGLDPRTWSASSRRRWPSPPSDALARRVLGPGRRRGRPGLLMSLVLQHRGIGGDVFDINPDRLAFAADHGADPLGGEQDREFDLVVDTVGSPASAETALSSMAVGGTLLIIGLDSRPMGLTAQTIVRRQLVVRGSLTYDHPEDFLPRWQSISNGA